MVKTQVIKKEKVFNRSNLKNNYKAHQNNNPNNKHFRTKTHPPKIHR